MRSILIFICSVIGLWCVEAAAQSVSPLRFEAISHDFGTIAEDGGEVEHRFRFENISAEPVVIVATQSSCGCTKAEFSRKPVLPHEKGGIIVRFSPMNYPGQFARKIGITTSAGHLAERLLVTGTVTPRKRSIAEEYPIVLGGGVRIDANAHTFGYAEHGKSVGSSFALVNDSGQSASLRIVPATGSGYLDVGAPATLAPHGRAEINFGYRLPENCGVYGRLSDIVEIEVNGVKSDISLIINAIAIESRDNFADTEEPRIVLSEHFIKFGTLNGNIRSAEHVITVSNGGNSPLVLRAIESERGLVQARIDGPNEVSVGESVRLRVRFTAPEGRYGAMTERLTIISNDPQSPAKGLKVSAIVER